MTMLLWLGFAVLTAIAVALVTRPLSATAKAAEEASDSDLAVYRQQLAEIEAERARGLLGEAEAAAARAEIGRRILAREAAAAMRSGKVGETLGAGASSAAPGKRFDVRNAAFFGSVILLPLLSVGLYVALGSPALPSKPFQHAAKAPGKASVNELVAQVEARLRDRPDDGQGWDVLGPVYLLQKRFSDAVQAFQRAIALLGESPKRLGGLGQASVLAANGVVTEPARQAFARLLELKPGDVEARFWLAVAKEQDGKLGEAVVELRAMLEQAPADAPYRPLVEERLAEIGGKLGPIKAVPGAKAWDGAADGIANLPAGERSAAIAGMVERLAARLAKDGKDLDGWLMLVRSYGTMGRTSEARAAIAKARASFAGDDAALTKIKALEGELGLGS